VAGVSAQSGTPPLSPTPVTVRARQDAIALPPGGTAGLALGGSADAAAARVVRAGLAGAGVRTAADEADADVTVWLGDAWPAAGSVLGGLGVDPGERPGPEGYLLAVGRDRTGRGRVVLAGGGPAGTFYAAQTFRHLLSGRSAPGRLPGVLVLDAPAMDRRGTVEGFYGTPWSHPDRLRHLDFLGAHKMNTYLYGPKDDPYHRELWRDPYPAAKLTELRELVARAAGNHVAFTFAVSPGLSMRYTAEEDVTALLAKLDAAHRIGCRTFAVAFDDIDCGVWHCAEDGERFGAGDLGRGAGEAQAYLLGRVQKWALDRGDVAPPWLVPTEYRDLADTPYKRALRQRLDAEVQVMWTGVDATPPAITAAEAAEAARVFGHRILVWDNYPVNDYLPGRVPLADYRGRENGLSAHVAGIVANPMNQAAMSEIALFSVADYAWNDTRYDARRSWRSALADRAGGRPEVAEALRVFADACTLDERLHLDQAPELAAAVAAFWREWRQGRRRSAVAGLHRVAGRFAGAPAVIRSGVPDGRFVAEGAAWLEAMELWGEAMVAAVAALAAVAEGDAAAGAPPRRRAAELAARARRCRDWTEPHRTEPVKIADGVLDRFVADACALHDTA
jgi:hyaluronoglucosaminidase